MSRGESKTVEDEPGGAAPGGLPLGLLSLGLAGGARSSERPEEERDLEEFLAACPDFELYECLGRGTTGVVYRATMLGCDEDVAVKLIHRELSASPGQCERLERDGAALTTVVHPGIAQVFRVGRAGTQHYRVTELVEGPSLRRAMETKLNPEVALGLAIRLCEALHHAHERGVVHCNVEPSSVLLDGSGGIKVTDFNLASAHRKLRNAHYSAPERIYDPSVVDRRSDVFSIGVIVYEMITGQRPLGRFLPPSEVGWGDTELDAVVIRALESERTRRFATASELGEALRGWLDRGAAEEPTPKPRRRWFRWWPLAVALAGLVSVWAWRMTEQPTEPSPSPLLAAATPDEQGVGWEPDRRFSDWPMRELGAMSPQTVAVLGMNWERLRETVFGRRLLQGYLARLAPNDRQCVAELLAPAQRAVVGFADTAFGTIILRGPFPDQAPPSCATAAFRTRVTTAADGTMVVLEHEGTMPLWLAYGGDVLVVEFGRDVAEWELYAKVTGRPVDDSGHRSHPPFAGTGAAMWGHALSERGRLPLEAETVRVTADVDATASLQLTATFASEAAASAASGVIGSYISTKEGAWGMRHVGPIDVQQRAASLVVTTELDALDDPRSRAPTRGSP